eukprot:498247_1
MATLTTKLLLSFFVNLIPGFHGVDMDFHLCNTPHGLPGCIDPNCEEKVCQTYPQCCEQWDLNCVQIACHNPNAICQSIGTACDDLSCHIPRSVGGCKSIQCTTAICEMNSDCCDKAWDASCAQLACDTIHGMCNTMPNACNMMNKPKTLATPFHFEIFQSRELLQTCPNDPCPGHQQRNPITCTCECPSTDSCPGNQIYSAVLCQCGCPTAPTCTSPQLFNVISCSCECPTVLSCGFAQQFDTETCQCITPITDCSMDPCPGYQLMNPLTCDCECATPIQCTGNQEFNVFCECGCPVTPICGSPKQFNPTLCECECMPITQRICTAAQRFNTNTCTCESVLPTSNALTTTTSASMCSSDPCPGIQQRNPITCECECEVMTQCPGNQDFNVLCECQCATTPICDVKQQFNPVTCACECLQSAQTCGVRQIWNANQCQCEDITYPAVPAIPHTTALCPHALDPCPGHQVRSPTTCDCECESQTQCVGNQEFNVFCECGCPATPICTTPQQFNVISCECECRGVGISTCNTEQILNANTCLCETATQARATTIAPTLDPTTALPTTSDPTTKTPTIPRPKPPIEAVALPTTSPHTPSPTPIPTQTPINTDPPTLAPSHDPSLYPTNNPSLHPTNSPFTRRNKNTITKKMICELDYDLEDLEPYLEMEQVSIDEWADRVIKTLIHYDDPIISESLWTHIVNVDTTDGIVIEYSLEMERVETFGIVLYHIDSTDTIILNDDWRFPIDSNQVIMQSIGNDCAVIGDPCDGDLSCCSAIDNSSSILCIANSESNAHLGTCCIDYNHYGCTEDSDCCFVNSYCTNNKMCRRMSYKRSAVFSRYEASDSEDSEEDVDLNETIQYRAAAALFMEKQMYDDGEYKSVPLETGSDGIVLSMSLKLLLCMVVIVIIGNVMCCVHEKWKKTKQDMKAKKPIDINNYVV